VIPSGSTSNGTDRGPWGNMCCPNSATFTSRGPQNRHSKPHRRTHPVPAAGCKSQCAVQRCWLPAGLAEILRYDATGQPGQEALHTPASQSACRVTVAEPSCTECVCLCKAASACHFVASPQALAVQCKLGLDGSHLNA
jgi:hypothetical protein